MFDIWLRNQLDQLGNPFSRIHRRFRSLPVRFDAVVPAGRRADLSCRDTSDAATKVSWQKRVEHCGEFLLALGLSLLFCRKAAVEDFQLVGIGIEMNALKKPSGNTVERAWSQFKHLMGGMIFSFRRADLKILGKTKSEAGIIVRISENHDRFVPHPGGGFYRMIDQDRSDSLILPLGQNAHGTESERRMFDPGVCNDFRMSENDIADDPTVRNRDESQFRHKILALPHLMDDQMLAATGHIKIPKRFPGQFLDLPIIFFFPHNEFRYS